MAVLAGIDEAGFGPILGPLVVSSTVFSLPDDLLSANLWRILHRSVSDKRKGLAGRLLIVDSKKAYTRTLGIKHLERTTLACLRCLGEEPRGLADMLGVLCSDGVEQFSEYPWYRCIGQYALGGNADDAAIAAKLLGEDLQANGMRLARISSCLLEVARYNRMVEASNNKSNVLFSAVCRLVKEIFDKYGRENLQVIIDRQGGRSRYRRTLQMMFPGAELAIIQEDEHTSSYEMRAEGRRMRLHFVVKADSRFLPVSLASMVCKYVRELLVDNINRYFRSFDSALKPTAGYWSDGLRFIAELKRRMPHVAYDASQLIRSR